MTVFVVDASVATKWFVAEAQRAAAHALAGIDTLLSPGGDPA